MANHKDILKQALNELPAGFAELLETAIIPAASEITAPASVEDALIACGKTAKYINAILAKLGGLPLLQVPLRVGQLNPSTQILAVAGLEFVNAQSSEVHIVAPVTNGKYYGVFLDWQVSASVTEGNEIVSFIGRLDGEEFSLAPGVGGLYTGNWPCPLGDHLFQAVATFADEHTASDSIEFRVASWSEVPTSPSNGEVITMQPESDIQIQVSPGASIDAISSVEVKSGDDIYTMLKDEAQEVFMLYLKPADLWEFITEAQIRYFEIIITGINNVNETVCDFALQLTP